MRIHLLINVHRAEAIEAGRKTVQLLRYHQIAVGADHESAGFVGAESVPNHNLADCDLMIGFGGDGTLIRAAHLCSERGTPILGVYYGSFGFVTQCTGDELGAALSDFFDGKAHFEDRMMLQADLIRHGDCIATVHALNELVLQRPVTDRMMVFGVIVEDKQLTSYPADGVMVATPTGSTGYNLSAGGPIADPMLRMMILSAVAPHTLSARTLILRPESKVELTLETEGDAVLSADGQTRLHLLTHDSVRVSQSPRVTRLMVIDKSDFLNKLHERLFWSHSFARGKR